MQSELVTRVAKAIYQADGSSNVLYGTLTERYERLAQAAIDATGVERLHKEVEHWKHRAFDLECQYGYLKGVYVAKSESSNG